MGTSDDACDDAGGEKRDGRVGPVWMSCASVIDVIPAPQLVTGDSDGAIRNLEASRLRHRSWLLASSRLLPPTLNKNKEIIVHVDVKCIQGIT